MRILSTFCFSARIRYVDTLRGAHHAMQPHRHSPDEYVLYASILKFSQESEDFLMIHGLRVPANPACGTEFALSLGDTPCEWNDPSGVPADLDFRLSLKLTTPGSAREPFNPVLEVELATRYSTN